MHNAYLLIAQRIWFSSYDRFIYICKFYSRSVARCYHHADAITGGRVEMGSPWISVNNLSWHHIKARRWKCGWCRWTTFHLNFSKSYHRDDAHPSTHPVSNQYAILITLITQVLLTGLRSRVSCSFIMAAPMEMREPAQSCHDFALFQVFTAFIANLSDY